MRIKMREGRTKKDYQQKRNSHQSFKKRDKMTTTDSVNYWDKPHKLV